MTTTNEGVTLSKSEATMLFMFLNDLRNGKRKQVFNQGSVNYTQIMATFNDRYIYEILDNREGVTHELARYFGLGLF